MANEREIGARLTIKDGTKFNAELKEVNANLKVLRSEMKLTDEIYDGQTNTVEALTRKHQILTKELTEAENKVKIYTAALEEEQRLHEQSARSMEELPDAIRKEKEALEELKKTKGEDSEETKKQEEAVEKLQNQLQLANENYERSGKSIKNYSEKQNQAEAEVQKLNKQLNDNDKYLDEAKSSADGTASSINNYGVEVSEATSKTSTFGDTLKASLAATVIKEGITFLANGMKTAAEAALDAGTNFNAAMSKVAAISGATGADLDALAAKAKQMGATTKFSASESAEALNYMAMAGWDSQEMLDGLEGVMNLAAASGEDLATTSDIVTDALTALGMGAEESGHFADVLAVASSNANTNVSMMGETFKYAASVAGSLGYSAEDLAEQIGLMANAGIKSTQAGTALRSIITRLSTDAGASSKSLGALGVLTKELGVQFYDATGKARPLNDVISDARVAWQGLSDTESTYYAKKIAGQNAISGWMALMNASSDDVRKLEEALQDCDGAAEDMAKTMNDNLKGDLTILQSALEGLGISAEGVFDETMRTAVQAATEAVGRLTDAVDNGDLGVSLNKMSEALNEFLLKAVDVAEDGLPKLIDGFTWVLNNSELVVSGIVGITAALEYQKVAKVVAEAWDLYAKENQVAATAQELLNFAMNANPAGLLITAIAGLTAAVGAYILITKNAKTETDKLVEAAGTYNDKAAQNAADRAAQWQDMEKNAEHVRTLVDRLGELDKKSALTATELKEQSDIIDELNTLYPDLNIEVDNFGRLMGTSVEEINAATEAMIAQNEAAKAMEDRLAVYEELQEAIAKQSELEDELTERQAEREAVQKKLNEAEDNNLKYFGVFQGSITTYSQQLAEAEEAERAVSDALTETNSTVSSLQAEYDALGTTIATKNAEAAQNMETLASTTEVVGGTFKQTVQDMTEEQEKFLEKLTESVTELDGLFSKLEGEDMGSLLDWTENLHANADSLNQYAEDVNTATSDARYGVDENFTAIVDTIMEKGPEGAGAMHEFAEALTGTTGELEDLLSAYEDFAEAQGAATASLTDAVTGYTDFYEEYRNTTEEGEEEVAELVTQANEERIEEMENFRTDAGEIATGTVEDMTQAWVDGQEPLVTANTGAMDALKNNMFTQLQIESQTVGDRSTVYYNFGKDSIVQSLADGIREGSSALEPAVKEMCQRIIDSIDLSGLVARIDQQLGEAVMSAAIP